MYLKFAWLKTSKDSTFCIFSRKNLATRRYFRTFWMPWRHIRWFVGIFSDQKTTKRGFFSVCRSGKFSTWRMTPQKNFSIWKSFFGCIWSLPDSKRLKIAYLAYFHAKTWPRGVIFALFGCFDVTNFCNTRRTVMKRKVLKSPWCEFYE